MSGNIAVKDDIGKGERCRNHKNQHQPSYLCNLPHCKTVAEKCVSRQDQSASQYKTDTCHRTEHQQEDTVQTPDCVFILPDPVLIVEADIGAAESKTQQAQVGDR